MEYQPLQRLHSKKACPHQGDFLFQLHLLDLQHDLKELAFRRVFIVGIEDLMRI
jgi:hypothetical protein